MSVAAFMFRTTALQPSPAGQYALGAKFAVLLPQRVFVDFP
jgi:hypothetical protein